MTSVTCGRLPGVGDEGGVVLYLVGEDGSAVVPPWLPHHHRVLAVALHPVQVRRVRHVLHDKNKSEIRSANISPARHFAKKVVFNSFCGVQVVQVIRVHTYVR